MCGIWVSIGLDVPPGAIDRVAHRGPDGRGWVELPTAAGPACIGHRLLAITGNRDCPQPARQAGSGGWLTYNGEIYNGAEVRAALEKQSVAIAGAADTWTVLAALETWGTAALSRFAGMFALAHLDLERRRLLVARDRFGIKPLYVWRDGSAIAFASEIKQFTSLSGFRARLSERQARDFLELGVTDHGPGTLWRDVTAIPPGTAVTVDWNTAGALRVESTRWYRLPDAPPGPAHAQEDFAAALRAAIEEHTPSAMSAGVSLSGGLDSSAIACLARGPLPCVSLAHDDPAVDESGFARAVTERLDAPLIPVRVDPRELPGITAAAVRDLDEPFPSMSVVAQWAVFRAAAAAGIKVMLTGQGADELLGGYPFLLGPHLTGLMRAGRLRALCRELGAQQRLHRRGPRDSLRAVVTAVAPARFLADLTTHGWADAGLTRARLAVVRGGARDRAPAGLAAFRRDLLGAANLSMLLRYEDRTAMAHGVESRPPFLDHRVVESALRFGADELIVGGLTKAPLRAVARDVLPPSVLHRLDKRGFPTPEAAWLKGPLRGYVAEKAASARARFPSLVSATTLAGVTATLDEPGPLRRPIWRVAALGAWADAFGVEA
jgi:asparagine synthase (glutamine-hydrolysing)